MAACGARAAAGDAGDRVPGTGTATRAAWSTLSCSGCASSARSRVAIVTIEYRWTEGRSERLPELAAELVRLKVDRHCRCGTPRVLAAKQATSIIPIVFVGTRDPVGSGLVARLARPGGNVTGVSQQATDTGGKRLELLDEIVGGLRGSRCWSMSAIPPPRWRLKEVARRWQLGIEACRR